MAGLVQQPSIDDTFIGIHVGRIFEIRNFFALSFARSRLVALRPRIYLALQQQQQQQPTAAAAAAASRRLCSGAGSFDVCRVGIFGEAYREKIVRPLERNWEEEEEGRRWRRQDEERRWRKR